MTTAGDIMTADAECIRADETILLAAQKMTAGRGRAADLRDQQSG